MPEAENCLLPTKIQLGLDVEHSYIEINKELQFEFKKLYTFLVIAIKKSKEEGKHFVLLVGENHYSLQSFFFKNLLIDMADQLGIKTVGYETTKKELWQNYLSYNIGNVFWDELLIDRLYLPKVRKDLSKLNPESKEYQETSRKQQKLIRSGQDGAEQNFLRTINYITRKKMELIPIDDPDLQIHEDAISNDGIIKRNNYMGKILSLKIDDLHHIDEGTIAIVGSAHLPEILDYLKDKYFVLTVDTADYSREQQAMRLMFNASIFINKEDGDTTYKVCATYSFKNRVTDHTKINNYYFYTPSKDFFTAVQRESLKSRAVLGIPRTLLLIFNKIKSACEKPDEKPYKVSCLKI